MDQLLVGEVSLSVVCVHVCMRACMCMHVCACVCVCVYIYRHRFSEGSVGQQKTLGDPYTQKY